MAADASIQSGNCDLVSKVITMTPVICTGIEFLIIEKNYHHRASSRRVTEEFKNNRFLIVSNLELRLTRKGV